MFAHGDFSQHHVNIALCILVAGGNHGRQGALRGGVISVQILGIDQAHTVEPLLLAQPVISSQRDIEMIRLHQNIKPLGIEIPLHGIAPVFVCYFKHFTQDPGFLRPADTQEFLPDGLRHPDDFFRVGKLFLHQVFYL